MKKEREYRQQTKADIERAVRDNTWWPFTRVDGALLQKLHREKTKQQKDEHEEALL